MKRKRVDDVDALQSLVDDFLSCHATIADGLSLYHWCKTQLDRHERMMPTLILQDLGRKGVHVNIGEETF